MCRVLQSYSVQSATIIGTSLQVDKQLAYKCLQTYCSSSSLVGQYCRACDKMSKSLVLFAERHKFIKLF